MKIASIAPCARLPKELGGTIYDYMIPPSIGLLQKGHIVRVPFKGTRIVTGVVVGIKKKAATRLKGKMRDVKELVYPEPLLTEGQIKLARDLARLSGVSFAFALKTIIPDIPKKVTPFKEQSSANGGKEVTHKEINAEVARVFSTTRQKFVCGYQSQNERDDVFMEIIQAAQGNVLIIVPEIADLKYFDRLYMKYVPQLVHSLLKKSELFNVWISMLAGTTGLITGTRSALFMPFSKLGAIIIDQEHSANLDNLEQKPHYRAQDVAEFLSKQHGCPLIFASYAPRVKTWEKAKYGVYKKIAVSRNQSFDSSPPIISLIDMNEEIKKGNYSPFSERLKSEIESGTWKNIFLFHNRKGHSTVIRCKDCEYIFECPLCQKSLVSHFDEMPHTQLQLPNVLKCFSCGHREDIPPLCPKCGSAEFKFTGKGTQKIEALLKKEFQGHEVIRLDSDSKKNSNSTTHHAQLTTHTLAKSSATNSVSPVIYIGTEYALSRIPWDTIGLVGLLNVDSMLSRPDPRAHERVYQLLKKIEFNVSSSSRRIPSRMFIQTFSPALPIFQSLIKNKSGIFYEHEIEMRVKK